MKSPPEAGRFIFEMANGFVAGTGFEPVTFSYESMFGAWFKQLV